MTLRIAALLFALALAPSASAQTGGVVLQTAFPGLSFSNPLELTFAPGDDSRLYVAEQSGRVLTFPNDASASTSAVFLSLQGLLSSGGERGLLGLAFHPDHATNGYVYVHYTRTGDGANVLARYTRSALNPNTADPASALVLLTIPQPQSNHNGGKLAFGPDGYLYLSIGDGGGAGDTSNNSQNRTNLLGTLIRIDVDKPEPPLNYGIPSDNPYVGNTQGFREEIYAYGLRNMWKFGFDSATGVLWGADVGQGAREEVNHIENGGNYGWRRMEGSLCYNPSTNCNPNGDLILPVYEYSHAGGACSISGGTVYRGDAAPALFGDYVYADYCTGTVQALTQVLGGAYTNRVLVQAGFGVTGFGEDPQGELYVLSQGSGATTIRRIVQPNVAAEGAPDAASVALALAGPQPFTDATAVRVRAEGLVRVTLTDALGRLVAVLHDGPLATTSRIAIDGRTLAPGVYVVRAESASGAASMRIVRSR